MQHQNQIGLQIRRFAAALVLPLLLAGCGTPAAAPAAPAESSATAAPAAPAIAMAADTQLLSPQVYTEQFATAGSHQLIDVRTPEEFASGHIEGAINIPVQEIGSRLDEIAQDTPVVLYCRSGNRSAQAATILHDAGFKGVYDMGGIQAWQQAGLPVVQCDNC